MGKGDLHKSFFLYQILHHCVCIGVTRCIYAIAKETAIIYCVLVTFSNKMLNTYRKTVVFVVERFIPFLQNPLELPAYPPGEAWGYAECRTIAIQQMQLRAQYINLVLEDGCPLPELSKLSPAVICGWNVTKHGIDTPCLYLSNAAPVHKKCSAPKLMPLRDVRGRCYNGLQIMRLLELYPRLDSMQSYKQYKKQLSQQLTFNDALYQLVNAGLSTRSIELIDPHHMLENMCPADSITPSQTKKTKRKRKLDSSPSPLKKAGARLPNRGHKAGKIIRYRRDKWVALEEGSQQQRLKSIRLNVEKDHNIISATELGVKKVGRCIVCCSECMGSRKTTPKHCKPWGFKTTKACNDCREFLCTKTFRWNGRSCWDVWHTDPVLPSFQCKTKSTPVEV